MLNPAHKELLQKYTSEHNGKSLNQKELLKPKEIIKKVLIARIMSMPPEQQQALKTIVTSQTADALKALLPELADVIDKGVNNGAG